MLREVAHFYCVLDNLSLPAYRDGARVLGDGDNSQVGIRAESLIKLDFPLAVKAALFQGGIIEVAQVDRFFYFINKKEVIILYFDIGIA